ncbi:hypothetical protein FBEOM_8806 [Fusarium beomiforme]|uniref:Apple domain-containing protein n=1 Tax=Fusarium beomiforme TaxID=44412 RepID=A0A9P5AEM2_9HYPO|nr:hypothetical protein FBEOM_8806 [Fusarium beomiforme]
MVALKSVLFLLAFGAEALGVTSNVICQSKYGTKSVASNKAPRATTTVFNQIVVVKKVTRKVDVVVVPRPKTTTEIETRIEITTTTVDDAETATETTTDEQITTRALLVARTFTSTSSTTTTTSSTSTIAAPAGFIPIKEVPGYRARMKARAAAPAALKVAAEYLQRVDCVKKVPSTTTKTTTTTVKGSRVTLKAKTVTKKSTTVVTVTQTEHGPQVTETETETLTVYRRSVVESTQTQTIPETVTIESTLPVETFYAACADNNLASTANGGKKIAEFDPRTPNRSSLITGLKSAYACCVECQKTKNCFMSRSSNGGSACWLYLTPSDDTCPAQVDWLTYRTNTGVSVEWTYSNGPCGKAINGGDSS